MGVRRLLVVGALVAAPSVALASGGSGGGTAPSIEYQRGLADYQAAKFASAAGHFRNVAEAQPRDAAIWRMLGEAYVGAGDFRGAEKALAKSVKLDPKSMTAHRDLAIALAKLNEDDKAKAELSELTARQDACHEACPEAAQLNAAVAAVQQALGVVTPTATLPLHGDFVFAALQRIARPASA